MPQIKRIKQTWRLIVKKTGEVVIKSEQDLDVIKVKSLKLIEDRKGKKHAIQYFENDILVDTEEVSVYFS